jgi:hypothetical protein
MTEKTRQAYLLEHPMRAFYVSSPTDHKTGVLDEKNLVPVAMSSLFHKNLHNWGEKFNDIEPPHVSLNRKSSPKTSMQRKLNLFFCVPPI